MRKAENKDKKESVKFEREDCEDVRILSSWVSVRADVRNRLPRGG